MSNHGVAGRAGGAAYPVIALTTLIAISSMLGGCGGGGDEDAQTENNAAQQTQNEISDEELISRNNRAVGLMGQYNYAEAHDIFAELVEMRPGDIELRVNLAIATLNRQQPGDEERAMEILREVLTEQPDHLRALYCLGLLELHAGPPHDPLPEFRQVAEATDDATAAYVLGQALESAGEAEDAQRWYEEALQRDPYLNSANLGLSRVYRQLGQPDRSAELIERFNRMEQNPRARKFKFIYMDMGDLAQTVPLDQPQPEPVEPPTGPLFASPISIGPSNLKRIEDAPEPTITVCDIDSDGDVDVFVSSMTTADADSLNLILINEGGRAFTATTDHPLCTVSSVNAVLWGDYDNDGIVDAYFCRQGPNQLWRQDEDGQWSDVTESTGTAGGDLHTVDGAFVDADHDGDLDIFLVNSDGGNELLNNNLDGSFTAIGTSRGISGDGANAQQVVFNDLDNDSDADIVVINQQPPHHVYLNHLLWEYEPAEQFSAIVQADIARMLAADLDADGDVELITTDKRGTIRIWQRDAQQNSWRQTAERPADEGDRRSPELASLDVRGDGRLSFVRSTATARGIEVIHYDVDNDEFEVQTIGDDNPAIAAWSPIVLNPANGPSLLTLDADDQLLLWPPGEGRFQFASLAFTGMDDEAQSMRSNASGIGVKWSARIGSRWVAGSTFDQTTAPGQSLQPTSIGLAGHERVDYLQIIWPDGLLQTELGLAAGEHHTIQETQRQVSSCPVLFAWDGQRYEFVSDILGVAGIGYLVAPGEYGEPRPWENFLFPFGMLQPRHDTGHYSIKLGEPMQEACYLDAAGLVAYDLPEGWKVVLDERMQIAGPAPTGEPIFYQQQWLPDSAVNERGMDVLETIVRDDLVAAPLPELDRRFIGRLQDEHVLTFTFDRDAVADVRDLVLIIDGWVEYPYSQTMFAAWQAGAEYTAPTLEVQDADGRWQAVYEQFGYPAGMPRRMALPLGDLPVGATPMFRLRTNQQIYFDRIALVAAEEPAAMTVTELQPTTAEVSYSGFPRRDTAAQYLPYYDHTDRRPRWDTMHMAGWYTQFGEVTPLIADDDNALAIFGPGEEVTIDFADDLPALPDNWRRYFVLETVGWCKDMDLYTKDGDTIEPLPVRGDVSQEAAKLHEQFNTRYEAGR